MYRERMNRKLIITFALVVILAGCKSAIVGDVASLEKEPDYANSIKSVDLERYLREFASAAFLGRATGTKGDSLARQYLKNTYDQLGVESHFQEVPLAKRLFTKMSLSINGQQYAHGKDFVTSFSSINDEKNFQQLIVSESTTEQESVKDKLVFIASLKEQGETVNKARTILESRITTAYKNGAAGVIIYDPEGFDEERRTLSIEKNEYKKGKISLRGKSEFFVVRVNETIGNTLAKGTQDPKASMHIEIDFGHCYEELYTTNVIGYIEGKENPKEYILLSAHLDHLGEEEGQFFHGADDNGSGTVALLEISEAFKNAKFKGEGPTRSIVFAHFAAEELGLLGSKYYSENPFFPIAQTKANLNIDMIGRSGFGNPEDREYIYMIGSPGLSDELFKIAEKVNDDCCNIELDYKFKNETNIFLSDHYYLGQKEIPYIFYFDGIHEDYHKVSDTFDKINYDLLASRTKYIFHTAWELANR